ncbi:DUF4384 domain-containing protein [Pelagicoccus sp. SDUM812002]|uniref:DUF4384 domain-containing protein n=1 Tax=Pelagicoccus sp. SDUM812002 TaxID=3041266 RepID=UPI00280FE77A|nr:DUF4384 domain-containing protein [Pelagicoccus sp. SDUM812002]MDQ8186863.1 DUF4384 domain-containing protein [Pelagicoccus sp. SDUM812002]
MSIQFRYFLTQFCLLLVIALPAILAAQDYGTGLVFDEQAYRAVPYKAPVTAETYANLPSAANLEKYTPTPGDQGPYSTCTAFAVGYHLRTILYGIEKQITYRSKLDQHIFSPTFVYERIKSEDDNDCMQGSSPVAALELLRTIGIPPLSTVPYQCGSSIESEALLEATEYPIIDYQILYGTDLANEDPIKVLSVKKSLSEGSPVVIGFKVHQSFYQSGPLWRELESDAGPTGQHGLHAMVVVGYDDNKYGGAMRVMNSWSPKWADKGFVWIPYADFGRNCIMALQAYGKRPARPTPVPGPDGVTPELAPLLKGKVIFQERDGTPMPAVKVAPPADPNTQIRYVGYRLARSYPSGTRFRFYITTNTDSYLYAFATDLTGKITTILPFADNMSPHIGPDSTIAFPSERKVVRMDNHPGTDYLLLLYSEEPLDIDALKEAMAANPGTLSLKVAQSLGSKIVPDRYIQYDPARIGFTVTEKTKGTVVPLMIEIPHH